MSGQFPGSPRVQKGGIIALNPPDPVPTVIVFQYNPDSVSRRISPNGAAPGGGRGDATRLSGPPTETLTMTVEIDATDQLEHPAQNALTAQVGLHPSIAALEQLSYPALSVVVANEALALSGGAFIAAEQAPVALLAWGGNRLLPVQVESLTVAEEAFDTALNPIRVSVSLSLRVLTHRDIGPTHPGYWVYMASLVQKETMAALGSLGSVSGLGVAL